MHIGVIPARKGSKRLKGKNRREINGVPLWERAVIKSNATCEMTVVNTDDELIMPTDAIRYERPANLTDGMSYRIDDVLLEMSVNFEDHDIIHLFQPTNPFIKTETVEKAKTLFEVYDFVDSVQAIHRVPNIYHAYSQRIKRNGFIEFAFPEEREECFNSQRKPEHYIFGGYVACRVSSLRKFKNIWGYVSLGVEIGKDELIDIDTEEDLKDAIRFTGINVRGEASISTEIRRLGTTI